MTLRRRAFPVVISAPSGAGKTTLARGLVEGNEDMVFSISATTRSPRPKERDGRDYHFVDDATFDRMIARDELAEWAAVHGRRYGTVRSEVTAALDRGRIVVLDIDVQGARQVNRVFPDAVLVFVVPPSPAELARRLAGRASEDEAERRRRLKTARRELAAVPEFDYLVVNDDVDRALERIVGIVRGEQARVERTQGVDAFVDEFDRGLLELLKGAEE